MLSVSVSLLLFFVVDAQLETLFVPNFQTIVG